MGRTMEERQDRLNDAWERSERDRMNWDRFREIPAPRETTPEPKDD